MSMKTTVLIFAFIAILPSIAQAKFNAMETELPSVLKSTHGRQKAGKNTAARIQSLYRKEFGNKGLRIEFDWESDSINAHAFYDEQDHPVVNVAGGMARHKYLTEDGLAMVICHEIGHFLGGEPKKLRGRSTKKSWSSAEGQADYYSAECLRRYFFETPRKKDFSDSVGREFAERVYDEAKRVCRDSLCERMVLAGFSLSKVYAQVKFYHRELSLVNPSLQEAYSTILDHPDPQCRLDTIVAGILEKERPSCWFVY